MPNRPPRKRDQNTASEQSANVPARAVIPTNQSSSEASNSGDKIAVTFDQRHNSHDKIQNWLMVIFTGLILFVTAVYSVFSYGQWDSMDRSIGEAQKSRELEYRAYVGAKGAVFTQRADNPAWGDVNLIILNSGRTPIREGKMRRVFERRDAPPPENTLINEEINPGSKIVFIPQIEYSHRVGAIPTGLADVLVRSNVPSPQKRPIEVPAPSPILPSLTPPEMPDFGPGWYVYGIIDYKDIFDKWHITRFCFYIAPKTASFVQCPTFNDAN